MKMDLGERAFRTSDSTSVSAAKHEEWEMREILAHIGLMTDTQQGHSAAGKEMTEFHCAMGYCDARRFQRHKTRGIYQGLTGWGCLQRETR